MPKDLTKEIILSAEAGQLEKVVEILKQGGNPNAMGPNSGALHVAAFNGHGEIVKQLLKAGANPNVADKQSFYPLHLAASKGHVSICSTLLKAGADIETKTDKGGTPLHVASASGYPKVVDILIKAGANINATDIYGYTPLCSASALGQNGCVKTLLKAGADVNIEDENQENALFKAIRRLAESRESDWQTEGTNNGRNVKYTLEKGAFRYYDGYEDPKDPLKIGKIMSIKDQKYCASQYWGPEQHLPYLEAFDTIKTLLSANPNVNTVNKKGQSPMWMACVGGDAKIIKELHKAGANFDAVEDNGEFVGATCLHRIASSGRIDGLEAYFQLNKDYDINVTDLYGWTPLHYLADLGGHIIMAEILLKKGADKTIKSTKDRAESLKKGITASEVAYYWNDNKIGDFLK